MNTDMENEEEMIIAVHHMEGALEFTPIYPAGNAGYSSVPNCSRMVTVFATEMRTAVEPGLIIGRCREAWADKKTAWFQYNQALANIAALQMTHMVNAPILQIRKFGWVEQEKYDEEDGIVLWIDISGMRDAGSDAIAGLPEDESGEDE